MPVFPFYRHFHIEDFSSYEQLLHRLDNFPTQKHAVALSFVSLQCLLPTSSPNLRLGIAAKPTWLPSMGRYPLMPRNFAGATRCRQGLGTGIPAGHDTFHSRTTVQRGILPVDPLDELLLPCYFHFTNHRETEKPLFIICYYLRRVCSLLRRRGWLCCRSPM